jgi:hypothetical protein
MFIMAAFKLARPSKMTRILWGEPMALLGLEYRYNQSHSIPSHPFRPMERQFFWWDGPWSLLLALDNQGAAVVARLCHLIIQSSWLAMENMSTKTHPDVENMSGLIQSWKIGIFRKVCVGDTNV